MMDVFAFRKLTTCLPGCPKIDWEVKEKPRNHGRERGGHLFLESVCTARPLTK